MSWDVVIVGGGVAGATAAAHLAADRARVLLLEREREPSHKVCGEFVSGEAWKDLEVLAGERQSLRDMGPQPIERVVLVGPAGACTAPLPFRGYGLSRLALDGWLLRQAARRGATVRPGVSVSGLEAKAGHAAATTVGRERLEAGCAVLATGKHAMRGHPRQAPPEPLIGLKMHLVPDEAAQRALAGSVELVLFPGGYAGLQLVEGGRANLCLLVEKGRFAALGRDWRRLLAEVPHLAHRLGGATPSWSRPLAIAGLAYGYLHPARPGEWLYRVGDQLAVVPSFTGDGMSMAMRSGALLARALHTGTPAPHFHAAATAEFRRPMRVARVVAAAGRHTWLHPLLLGVCQRMPGLMTMIAHATRIPDASA